MSAATPGDNPLHLPALYTPRASKQVAIYPIDGFFLFPPEREQCCNGASQPELSWNQGIASESRQIIMNGGAYGRGGKINTNIPFQFNKKRLSCLYLLTLCFMLAGTSLKECLYLATPVFRDRLSSTSLLLICTIKLNSDKLCLWLISNNFITSNP